jgi:hypothetical protein
MRQVEWLESDSKKLVVALWSIQHHPDGPEDIKHDIHPMDQAV